MSKGGNFEIKAWPGGYPVWCQICYDGENIARVHHAELSDLKYAVEKAMQEARNALPEQHKDEV